MIRFLLNTAVFFAAAAIGLLVAAWVLPDMTLTTSAFFVDVLIFALLQAILSPFFLKVAARNMSAIVGAVGLLSTLAALLITAAISDGLQIDGFGTWLLAAIIIWLVGMLAAVLLPVLVVKRIISDDDGGGKSKSKGDKDAFGRPV